MNIEKTNGRGDYKPPTALSDDLEQQKQTKSINNNGSEQIYTSYSQFSQIDGKKLNETKGNSKVSRNVSWLTSQSSDTERSGGDNSQYYNQQQQIEDTGISFDGIKYGLMGAMNLFTKDNFTSYIIRGIQARNPNVRVVQILANNTVQKCKEILNRLRIECYIFLVVALALLFTISVVTIQSFTNEIVLVILLLSSHFLITIAMLWNAYTSQRYFLPEKAKLSMGLCFLLLITIIGVIIAKSDESRALPNSISLLLLIQFITSGVLFHINRQISLIYKIFV